MKTFKITTIVSGCHNCPYSSKDTYCAKVELESPEEYSKLDRENYFLLTDTCPMKEYHEE